MNLSIILGFPWFGGWGLEATFYADLEQWRWFNYHFHRGEFKDTSIGKKLGLDNGFFTLEISILCFVFTLEGIG